ncbi:hypothetical protein Ciccas_014109 [Cichlidogyrus casuarinus]|uniref:Uncharacterized protein n=1 Tax=Cichlidogyrus casuarinus TaxID=1844966 RepID=A0ABD2PIX7_9PLAT
MGDVPVIAVENENLLGAEYAKMNYQDSDEYREMIKYVLNEFEKVYDSNAMVVEHRNYTLQIINGFSHKISLAIKARDCDCLYNCTAWIIMRPWLIADGPDSIQLNCVKDQELS